MKSSINLTIKVSMYRIGRLWPSTLRRPGTEQIASSLKASMQHIYLEIISTIFCCHHRYCVDRYSDYRYPIGCPSDYRYLSIAVRIIDIVLKSIIARYRTLQHVMRHINATIWFPPRRSSGRVRGAKYHLTMNCTWTKGGEESDTQRAGAIGSKNQPICSKCLTFMARV